MQRVLRDWPAASFPSSPGLSGLQAQPLGLAPLLSHGKGPKDTLSDLCPPSCPFSPARASPLGLPTAQLTPTSGPQCPPAMRPHRQELGASLQNRLLVSTWETLSPRALPFTCLASLTESLVSRVRRWGSRWKAGAISTTFWCRRWMEQSRSYRCRTFPYWSPGAEGKRGLVSPGI